jgi:hypothetical protein
MNHNTQFHNGHAPHGGGGFHHGGFGLNFGVPCFDFSFGRHVDFYPTIYGDAYCAAPGYYTSVVGQPEPLLGETRFNGNHDLGFGLIIIGVGLIIAWAILYNKKADKP